MASRPPRSAPSLPHDAWFGHPPGVVRFWRRLIAATPAAQTPFYLFSTEPIRTGLAELEGLRSPLPLRHWLSCKTQPLPAFLQWWREQARPIEVVSELELVLALEAGFPPDQILVNGPAKHRWLPRYPLAGLRVNFDSATELPALLPVARQRQWRVGLRLLTASEFDPGQPELPTQFGFEPDEAVRCVRRLRRAGMEPETLHFHLRTNLARAGLYRAALEEAAALCRSANWQPRVIDLGGGFPPAHTTDLRGRRFDEHFCLREVEDELARVPHLFPSAQEIWLENGRFLSARSGVLVVSVLDVKERRGLRQLICDGGRTMNALVSTWEEHGLFTLPARSGPETLTAVHGPTCMAFDRLTLRPLSQRLRCGDRLVWMEAGAYHLPWETRFSHGLAEIWWHDGLRISQVRRPETLAAPARCRA